ncbi:VOC family protein [Herbiconiux sp. CPCC 205763]|uniref:VOC family protein n=1 Tax=Herbiconiux aconitum TaxID=2970913 RepID=A0ABT2GRF3_9MICO|nr:VOC family protein [Herbiconiux aconitum]MCS5717870.1 VOC family protein [Herbiconiux aconitum]
MNGETNPVVHFEIIGADAPALRAFYAALFGWRFDTTSPVAPEISDAGQYGFIEAPSVTVPASGLDDDGGEAGDDTDTPRGFGIPGGVGGGPGRAPHALFYVGVPDVEAALREAERLGGTRVLGPAANPNGMLVVGHFADPEGTLVGVAGPA